MARSPVLDLNKLTTFDAVARLGSFTAAAHELSISQPAVSIQIRGLEHHFGVPLLHRGRRGGARPTTDGEKLHAYVRRILSAAAEAEETLLGSRPLRSGRLLLVATGTAASYVLPPVLGEMKTRHPGLRVQLLVRNSQDALAVLLGGEADLGVLTGPVRDRRLQAQPFFEDDLLLAVAPGHRLARRRSVAVRELAGEPLILREPGSATRALVESELRQAGVRFETTMELASYEATLQAVVAGVGAAIVSSVVLRRDVEARRLVALRVRGVTLRRTFSFVSSVDGAEPLAVQRFKETARRLIARM